MESTNEVIFKVLRISELSKVPVLLIGNPGCGKTTSVEIFSRLRGYDLVLLRGSQSSAEEILGYDVNQNDGTRTTTRLVPKWYTRILENSKNGIRSLLFLDEITTVNTYTQAALLNLIFEKKLTDEDLLPSDCLIVAAGNYSGNLSSDFNIIPPLMNRFCIINIQSSVDDINYFMSKYNNSNSPESIIKMIMESEGDANDPEVVKTVGRLMESSLVGITTDLCNNSTIDLNVTEISGIYQNDLGSNSQVLPGFVTWRTLNYYRDMSIYTYLLYGVHGIESKAFKLITTGLVGFSFSIKNNKVVTNKVDNDYISTIKLVANELGRMTNATVSEFTMNIESISKKDNLANSDYELLYRSISYLNTINNDISSINPINSSVMDNISDIYKKFSVNVRSTKKSDININKYLVDSANYNILTKSFIELNSLINNKLVVSNPNLFSDTIHMIDTLMRRSKFMMDYLKKILSESGIPEEKFTKLLEI